MKKLEVNMIYACLTFKRDWHHLLEKPASLEEEPVLDEKIIGISRSSRSRMPMMMTTKPWRQSDNGKKMTKLTTSLCPTGSPTNRSNSIRAYVRQSVGR